MTDDAISAAFAQVGPGVRAIMVFDSRCVLCSGTVQWVIRHDPEGRVAFAGTESAAGAGLYALSGHDADATFLLVTRDGVRVRSDAGLAMLEILGVWPRSTAAGRLVPRVVRDGFYDLVARNRYRVFGRRRTCAVPNPGLRARFLV